MKLIVFLLLISNISLAQDLIVPRRIIESCRENYDKISKLEEKILNKDSIINNRDTKVTLDSMRIDLYQKTVTSLLKVNTNNVEIIGNKDKEIKSIKNTLNLFVGISGLELVILLILLL